MEAWWKGSVDTVLEIRGPSTELLLAWMSQAVPGKFKLESPLLVNLALFDRSDWGNILDEIGIATETGQLVYVLPVSPFETYNSNR